MKLAVHRSIIFWSGLLVMAFIGWVWRDSLSHRSMVLFNSGRAESWAGGMFFTGVIRDADLGFYRLENPVHELEGFHDPVPAPHVVEGSEFGFIDSLADTQHFPEEVRHPRTVKNYARQQSSRMLPGTREYFIPYWLIQLVVVLPWLALLAWRARRKKRIVIAP